ncbi:MAG TPA: SPW repeat protein [Stellaceae bacterium]|nr:SPW repeat protein [Stellaceae bacterium]
MATVAVGRFRDVRRGNSAMDWTKLAIAVWLFISPWVLGHAAAGAGGGAAGADVSSAVSWNSWIAAVLVAALAMGAIIRFEPALQWLMLSLGAWLFITPWVLGSAYANMTALDWNFWAVGAAVFFLSAAELSFMLGTRTLVARERVSAMPERDLSYAGERPRER